jgi:MFS family permease
MVEAPPQTWVCQAWHCGEIYEGTDRFCPTCRNVAVPQKRIRRAGVALIVLGLLLVGMMGALTWFLAPMMLGTGQQDGGTSFSGSQEDARVILGLFGAVALFGLGALVAGYIQLRYGRQNWKVVGGMIGVLAVIGVIGWLIQNGFLLRS